MKYPYKKWSNIKDPTIITVQAWEHINRVTVWKNNTYIKEYTLETFPIQEFKNEDSLSK